MVKYAADESLLVPEKKDVSLAEEFLLSQKLAADSKLIFNMSKQ